MEWGITLQNIELEGKAYFGKITKQLVQEVPPHSIIIIQHEDIDIVAAEDMVRRNIAVVLNTRTSITGKLPRTGVSHLYSHGIPVIDIQVPVAFTSATMDIKISIDTVYLWKNNNWESLGEIFPYTEKYIKEKTLEGQFQFDQLYTKFSLNSFQFASMELDSFLSAINKLPRLTNLEGKCTVIVARGAGVEEDLKHVLHLIDDRCCTVMAVDGASALLYRYNLNPDYIIGDMDSIPKEVLPYSSQYIAHSYMNGTSPGQERLKENAIPCEAIPFPGLSEDLAIMLAYVSGSTQIITLGCRNSVVELVEKGRKGMGSTLLTRMYAGDKISDLKALSQWISFQKTTKLKREFMLENSITEEYQVDES